MSFILDALKRADAERARGTVPGLAAQPLATPVAGGAAMGRGRRTVFIAGVWGVAALGMVILAITLGRAWWQAEPADAMARVAVGAEPGRLSAEARPAAALSPTNGPVAPAPLLVQADTRPAVAATGQPGSSGVAGWAPAPGAQGQPERAVAEQHVLAWEELPPDIRQRFPKVKPGGGMYSPQASSRLVVLNDQVLHEGDQVAPGLVVLEIRPTGVVLGYQERRVLLKF